MSYDIAFIGTGPDPDDPQWGESAAMAYRHAAGYDRLDECELVAVADLVRENAEAFADRYEIPHDNIFENFEDMLATETPDVVSIATPVPTHAPLVLGCIDHPNAPAAIHCEKPMADTYADSKAMADAAAASDVQLTFNHQRRFGAAWQRADELLTEGAIGEVQRIEIGGKNFLDYGTHLIDLANKFAGDGTAEWMLAQVDYRDLNVRYGTHNENQGVGHWRYDNGVQGLALVADNEARQEWDHRVVGSEGVMEINGPHGTLAVFDDDGWTEYEVERGDAIAGAIEHIITCLDTGEEPELSAANALEATEIIFGAWESVRRRGRVDFPLDIEDNPLSDLVERGELTPQ